MIIPLDTSRWMPKEDQRVVQTIECCESNVRRESLKCLLLGYVYTIQNGFLAGTKTIPESLLFTLIRTVISARKAAFSRSLKWRVTNRIGVHTDTRYLFVCWPEKLSAQCKHTSQICLQNMFVIYTSCKSTLLLVK